MGDPIKNRVTTISHNDIILPGVFTLADIGKIITIWLKNNEWTHKQLADKMHVTESTVQKWAKGINRPKLEDLKLLSEIFYIDIQNFFVDHYELPEYYHIDTVYMWDKPGSNDLKSMHTVFDAALYGEAKLHRFKNCKGKDCSAICVAGEEVWWHYREYEPKMLKDWNDLHKQEAL